MKIRIEIMPRAVVLDPQGKAIAAALQGLGYAAVTDARQGKLIELSLDETDPNKAEAAARAMADTLLANALIEEYRIITDAA